MKKYSNLKIGDVFTPHKYAKYFLKKYNVVNEWLHGATVFDPTMGQGDLLLSLVELAIEQGHNPNKLPYHNLFGYELNTEYYNKAVNTFKKKYKYENTFKNTDFIEFDSCKRKYDIILGNPPWINFSDIEDKNYKEFVRSGFIDSGLIEMNYSSLLGNSRVDLSTLIIYNSVRFNLNRSGLAIFFAPLSILLNVGANDNFKKFITNKFCLLDDFVRLCEVYDLKDTKVFKDIATRCGVFIFEKGKRPCFPVPYMERDNVNKKWRKTFIHCVNKTSLLVSDTEPSIERIAIPISYMPRSGINTCGANDIFFFDSCEEYSDEDYILNSKHIFPKKFIYPLLTTANFKGSQKPHKFVLFLYHENGKSYSDKELRKYKSLYKYIYDNEYKLKNRKNKLLEQLRFYAIFGIGKYCFAKYKVVWEAYGKKEFNPQIFEGHWQVNQSLQAYIPCDSKEKADWILEILKRPFVERYLKAFKMEGTMNWAQPGKIKNLFEFY